MKALHLAIVGGGPGALLILKRILELEDADFALDIFESASILGVGMPFSPRGANVEHDTNVSEEEIPDFEPPLSQWVKSRPTYVLEKYGIDPSTFDETKILPRLLFGEYLQEQFSLLLKETERRGMEVKFHLDTTVTDIKDDTKKKKTAIVCGENISWFDRVIICCGHRWPHKHEKKLAGYFDSPYPPSKLNRLFNHPIAIRGSSLTAVDAIRTLARNNGTFSGYGPALSYRRNENAPQFKMVMYSHNGLLPCARIFLEEPNSNDADILPPPALEKNMAENDGFLMLDFIFEIGYKEPLKEKDPAFFKIVKDMNVESFSKYMLEKRMERDPFELLREEYEDGIRTLENKIPTYWKEQLSTLSFELNYPAKHMPAEDMLRLHEYLLPLVAVVIAYLPQSSCEELFALHDAGCLELVSVEDFEAEINERGKIACTCRYEDKDEVVIEYETFIDCIGQPPIKLIEFPFQSLIKDGTASPASLKFKSSEEAQKAMKKHEREITKLGDDYFLSVPGLAISDSFQIVDANGKASERVYLMSVPYMSGLNPDYSGIDFCEHASELVVNSILDIS